jgi:hypothetical protein
VDYRIMFISNAFLSSWEMSDDRCQKRAYDGKIICLRVDVGSGKISWKQLRKCWRDFHLFPNIRDCGGSERADVL